MALTTYGIVLLIGATLSLRFNVFILFPAIGLALIGTIAVGIAHGDPMGSVVLTMVLIGTTLQVGYLAGIVARAVVASIGESNVDNPRNFAYRILQYSFSMFNKIDFSHSVQAKIGQELRARFEVPHELPHRMLTLIMQFDANRSGAIR